MSKYGQPVIERHLEDFYSTDPKAVLELLKVLPQRLNEVILEPSCGDGAIAKTLVGEGYHVYASDIVDRGYGKVADFFSYEFWGGDIVMNPPYKEALKHVKHAIQILDYGMSVYAFLRLSWLESKERRVFFDVCPPKMVWVSSSRLKGYKNGEEIEGQSAVAYMWIQFEKGYKGKPTLSWFN